MRRALATIAGFLASLLLASTAHACGHCIEDRMAAVYDHAVMTRAAATGHKVAFYAVLGAAPTDDAASHVIRRAVEAVRGVDKNTVRYSGDLAALSLSFDPRAARWGDVDRGIAKALALRGLTLGLINIVDRPEQISAGRVTAAAAR